MSAVHDVVVESRCRVYWPSAMTKLEPVRQIVRGILAADSLALCMGDAGTGKSTLALDMGCSIATGKPWRGLLCERGLVLHVAGEGMHGLKMRLAAAIREERGTVGMPDGLIAQSLDLVQPGELAELQELIAAAESECGEKPPC